MPKGPMWTVVGPLSADELTWTPTGTFRGSRPHLIPPGGWGWVGPAPSKIAARSRAVASFDQYTAGVMIFDLEIVQETPRRGWRRWFGRKPRVESKGQYEVF